MTITLQNSRASMRACRSLYTTQTSAHRPTTSLPWRCSIATRTKDVAACSASWLTYCTIQAPISGVVTQLDAVPYATAVPGETLFRIVDTEHLKVCFDILENELHRFEKGTEITVAPVSFIDDRHYARITAVSPVVESNGVVHLEATLTPHPHLIPGMSAIIALGKIE